MSPSLGLAEGLPRQPRAAYSLAEYLGRAREGRRGLLHNGDGQQHAQAPGPRGVAATPEPGHLQARQSEISGVIGELGRPISHLGSSMFSNSAGTQGGVGSLPAASVDRSYHGQPFADSLS